ncbi:MAG TPA: Phenylacetic acid catabolic protein, partial [Candidatus Binatia bacterium]|nr:Phenylacetic acid catabolic protein [Candidatus Binatia bacterium]
MFNEKIELKDFHKQDPEYQDLLRRVLAIQADCEIGGPNLYVKNILPTAPSKVDQLIVARTAAEEIDHFRKIAKLAGDIGVDVSYVLNWPNEKRYVEAFRGSIKTWEDYAVFGFLIDRVGRYQLEEFLDCSYLPLDRVVKDSQVIREEEGHIDFGTNKTAEYAAKGGEAKERIQ